MKNYFIKPFSSLEYQGGLKQVWKMCFRDSAFILLVIIVVLAWTLMLIDIL